jgi:hypothetical protein
MLNQRAVVAAALGALVLSGCAGSSSDQATPPTRPSASEPAPAPAATGGNRYDQALALHSCYEQIVDAVDDPQGLAVPCDQPKAAWRLAGIQAASAGDCPANQASDSEKQVGMDTVPPTLCLEPVTH